MNAAGMIDASVYDWTCQNGYLVITGQRIASNMIDERGYLVGS
jgi:hypothetical protein